MRKMLDPASYPHPAASIKHIETHISHVFLAGQYAYKIKKNLDLGFVDFSTLAKRKFYCQEEIRLNSRLAPEIYLKTMAIVALDDGLRLEDIDKDTPNTVEYAVQMLRFSRELELDCLLNNKPGLSEEILDRAAKQISGFHTKAAIASPDSGYGTARKILQPAKDNFSQIEQCVKDAELIGICNELKKWSLAQWHALTDVFTARLEQGFVRECHGDMHLANMVYWRHKVHIFDAIEFNPDLHWIDVISDMAFLAMDLASRGWRQMSWQVLNVYFGMTGDYQGLQLLNFYQIYRAVVRAKVAAIRYSQLAITQEEKSSSKLQIKRYLELAKSYTVNRVPILVIMHGLSGSGKSTVAVPLANKLHAVLLRSDVERKRLFGILSGYLGPKQSGSLYTAKANNATYKHLGQLVIDITSYGFPVVVDATFLKVKRRMQFYKLAVEHGLNFIILSLNASKDELFRRVQSRTNDISDADSKVLKQQLTTVEPITEAEAEYVISVISRQGLDIDKIVSKIKSRIKND